MIAERPMLLPSDEVLTHLRRTAPEPGMVLPDYSGYSICNVSQLILRNFGLPNRCPDCLTPILDRKYRRVVLFILDALGWNQLHRFLSDVPPLQRIYSASQVVPLTVTFPSTTTVALTAIYTGLTPVEHTITGHNVYLRELGAMVDVLRFSPYGDPRREVYAERGVDVHQLFPMYTVFEPLKEAGLQALSITRGIFTNTALGWLHHVGADVVGYLHAADMFVHLKQKLVDGPQEGLIALYWDVVDMLAHEYGPFSEVVQTAVDHFFYSLERTILEAIPPADRKDTLVLMTADHGQCDALPEEAILLGEEKRLNDLLMLPPAGQSRAAWLYANQGQADEVGRELERFADRLRYMRSEEALAAGLFGPPEQAHRIRHRVGDWVTMGRNGTQVLGTEILREQLSLKGRHGSLTEHEMLVPLIAMPLEAW